MLLKMAHVRFRVPDSDVVLLKSLGPPPFFNKTHHQTQTPRFAALTSTPGFCSFAHHILAILHRVIVLINKVSSITRIKEDGLH